MAEFSYRGRNAQGELINGTIEAGNEGSAVDSLVRRGVVLLDIAESSGVRSEQINWRQWLEAKIKLADLIIFTRQMYSLTKAGIPLLRAIDGLAENTSNKRLARALRDTVGQLEKGRTLSAAMASHPKVFPRLLVAVVHVGENTGQLEQAFAQLAAYLEKEQDTRKQVKAATRYPSFVLLALVAAMFVLNIFVIPTFASMFSRFGVELPLATRILIGTSNFFVNYWHLLLAGIAAGIFMLQRYIRSPAGRLQWDYLKLRIPAVGSILMRSMLARFSRSFSVMLSAGVPLTQALSLVADAVDNAWGSKHILDMRRNIEKGESLSRVSRSSGLFTPLVLQMIAVGEETGRVDDLLGEVAEYYEREVDYDLKTLTARLEPMLIVVVAALLLVMAMGIFLPMWDMMNAYQGR